MSEEINSEKTKIGVVGAGAWGTALAQLSAKAGCDVILWAREEEVVASINERDENEMFLAGVPLESSITATSELSDMAGMDFIFMVVPAQFVRPVLNDLKPHISENTAIVLCAKGIEQSTGKLMSDVVTEILPKSPLVVLSGPKL